MFVDTKYREIGYNYSLIEDRFMYKKLAALFLFVLLLSTEGSTGIVNIGSSNVIHHAKKDYRGGTQNWSIEQDLQGFMYFANNNGLLIFDGTKWQLQQMPNFSIVRSVFADKNGQIYVGAFNELGKIKVSKNGRKEFSSLRKYIPSDFLNFDDIWKIAAYKDQIIYQSYNYAFFFSNDSIVTVLKAPERFQNSFCVNERLYFNDMGKGLLEFSAGSLNPLPGCEGIAGEEVTSILPFGQGNNLMICTLNKGIFLFNGKELKLWNVPVNSVIKRNQIYSAATVQDDCIAIGTVQDGIYLIGKNGEILQHINRFQGLQNNTVLNIFADRDANLWLGLDNGIDYLNTNSPISFIQQADRIGSGYTSIIYKGKIYLGTNQGLFVKSWENNNPDEDFRLIAGTNGQVWNLGIHDDILLCGHNKGTYVVDGEKATQISKIPGAWKFHQLKRFPGYLIGGTYSGLIYFKKQNGAWVYAGRMKGFDESFRIFEEDENGDVWMSHGFKGIYKIQLDNQPDSIISSRFYTVKDGLPTNFSLNVYKLKGHIVVASNAGFYEYNPKTDRFEVSVYFNQLLSPLRDVSYLKEDTSGNIWYISQNLSTTKAGVFRIQEDATYKQINAPFGLLTGHFIHGFEFIYDYSNDHVFFGTQEGFAHYAPLSEFNQNADFSTVINGATALHLDSVFYYGNELAHHGGINQPDFSFPFKNNAFRFSFTSPSYNNQENIEYSFLLSGPNTDWSAWSSTTFIEFANLPPGDYVFSVKARNQMGVENAADSLSFSIDPPWYKSVYAYVVYFMLIAGLLLFVVWFVFKRIEISKKKERIKQLRAHHQKEQDFKRQSLVAEKKIIKLKNDQLKIEMVHRDKELANQTMDLIRKNKFLGRIKEDLEKLKGYGSEGIHDKISSLITKIDKDIDHKKQWEVFETAFDEVHEDFLNRLKTQHPSLTPKELKLCAYLRLNISTKEIAPLMNISVRGVEICRYRVRKKLNIDRDQNLTSMIIDL